MTHDLTLEKLVRIVVEAAEQVIVRQRLVLAACAFENGSKNELTGLMRSINDSGKIYSDTLPTDIPDVFFIDVIPLKYVPKLALGISEADFTDFFNRVLWAGKKIVVMRRETVENPDVKPMFDCYYKMLESYGVLFRDGAKASENKAARTLYTGNVLSKKDLIENAADGRIFVSPEVVVTGLAREEAARLGIEIGTKE